jgi:Winged helix-turn helix
MRTEQGAGRSHQHSFPRCADQARSYAQSLSRSDRGEGPISAVHRVVRWRACDLIARLHEEFGLSVSDDTIYRALKVGFSHVSARPEGYKQAPKPCRRSKNFAVRVAEVRAELAPVTPVEVWFQDEMRVGQKNKLTYRWAMDHKFCMNISDPDKTPSRDETAQVIACLATRSRPRSSVRLARLP